MRLLSQLAATALLLSAVTACATDGDEAGPLAEEADWRTGGKGDGETCDFTQMSAATYYEQFSHKVKVAGWEWYRVGTTWSAQPLLDNGNKANLHASFVADNRVILDYEEQKSNGDGTYDVLNRTVIVTRSTIDASTKTITIAGIGSGTPITLTENGRCAPGIAFQFTNNVRSPGLASDGGMIQPVWSSMDIVDPDHLDQAPKDSRDYFQRKVADGTIKVVRM